MTTQEAIDHYGTLKALADELEIWPHTIYKWGIYPPMSRQYELEVKTKGALKATLSVTE